MFRTTAIGSILGLFLVIMSGCSFGNDDDAPGASSTTPIERATTTSAANVAPTSQTLSSASPTTAAPVSSPVPSRDRTAQLAYFHIAPTDGESPATLAERAGFITLTHGDETYRDELRATGYVGLVLQFIVASEVNGPGPYRNSNDSCDASFKPLRNGVAREVGEFCAEVHPNEDWFLHNGAGERLYDQVGSTGVWYHMNPASEGWRTYAIQKMMRDLSGPDALGYDGIFLDNLELSRVKATQQLTNADGTIRELPSEDAFQKAWLGYLAAVASAVRPSGQLWANMVSDPNTGEGWNPYLEYLDGAMFPAFATGYDGLSVPKWTNNLVQAEAVLAAGKGVVAVGVGSRDDFDKQMFALASYLLVSDLRQTFFRYVSNENPIDFSSFWLYPNYDVTLGDPLGPRHKDGTTWRRDFECGFVTVTPLTRSSEIVQTECLNSD